MRYHIHISYQSIEGLIVYLRHIIHSQGRNYLRYREQGILFLWALTRVGINLGQAGQVSKGGNGCGKEQ